MRTSTIHFYGGAGTVTGSNFLLDTGGAKFLVDCGLFQGKHTFEDANWAPFQFDPKKIDVLINTHAHIDHIGRIPKLVRDGFRGKIISTEATKALAEPLLLDAMELLRRTAQRTGKELLYDEHDITQALQQWEGVPYHRVHELADGCSLELLNAGHILGSAMARISREGKTIVFTGDLGGGNSPLLSPHEVPKGADYMVMESVYGDRVRSEDKNRIELLENVVESTTARGGTLLIPAFSTERTQDLVYELRSLMLEKRVPSVPVYLDSPLAEKITKSYLAHPKYFSKEMQERIASGEHIFDFPELHFITDAAESQRMGKSSGPKIIIAGSGMSNGGRVISHEAAVLPDERSTLLIVGYQAAGSLGRQLVEGAKSVDIHGEKISVRAKVETIYGYSAHMDSEQLLEFVNETRAESPLAEVFVVMGEPAASSFLVQRIRDYLGVRATAPEVPAEAKINL